MKNPYDKDPFLEESKDVIKKNVDILFNLFKDDLVFFEKLLKECEKLGQYDKDTEKNVDTYSIQQFIIREKGKTEENVKLIHKATDPVFELFVFISESTTQHNFHNCNYMKKYVNELLVNVNFLDNTELLNDSALNTTMDTTSGIIGDATEFGGVE